MAKFGYEALNLLKKLEIGHLRSHGVGFEAGCLKGIVPFSKVEKIAA